MTEKDCHYEVLQKTEVIHIKEIATLVKDGLLASLAMTMTNLFNSEILSRFFGFLFIKKFIKQEDLYHDKSNN